MFCPGCGTQIPDGSSFCLKCGRSMSVAPNVVAPETEHVPASTRRWRIDGASSLGLFAVAVIICACAFYYLNQHTAQTSAQANTTSPETAQRTPKAEAAATATRPPSAPPPPPAPLKLSPGEIAAKYSDAVVVLESYDDQGQKLAQGSGFVLSPDGKVFTNYHVIRGASRMLVRMHDQTTHDVEYIAGFDMAHDVAALKISGEGLPAVHLGNSRAVKTGDHVTFLGAPLGLESTLSDGIISAVREAGNFRLFQTSAPISHGSSGGPLFDDYGNVVGLAVATMETGENLNFAVPIDAAKALLIRERKMSFDEMLSQTAVRQPILTSSLSVPPQVMAFDILVPQQGGLLAGSLSIAGGLGNDLGVSLASANGSVVWNGGVIQRYGNLSIPLRGGRYKLVFNNKMGPFWVSSKTVSGTVELSYYR